jgi:hypothetical protein
MDKALDEVYQRELPGWDRRGDGLNLGGAGGRRITPTPGSGSAGSGSGSAGPRPFDPGSGSGGSDGASGSAGNGRPDFDDPANDPPDPVPGPIDPADPDDVDDGTPRNKNGTPGDPRRHGRGGRSFGSSSGDAGGGTFSGIATVLLWGLVVVIGILVVLFFVRQASGVTGEEEPVKTKEEEAEDPAKLLAVIERPRDDADQLAFEGRYADAIHTLLLRTLHELASQSMVRITPAMTSREVLAKVPLLGDSRTALAGLVTAVELTWFGDDVPGPEDYARCRAQFELFAAAYRRGAAQAQVGAPGPAAAGARA